MKGRPLIFGLAGSLRERSFNRALLRAAVEVGGATLDIRIFDRLAEIPLFNEDLEGPPSAPAVEQMRNEIHEAQALLLVTPEYNRSIPGVLKNAVDWASRPPGESVLAGKAVLVIGASPGRRGAQTAQEDLRRVLRAAGAQPLESGLAVGGAHQRFDEQGRLTDEAVRDELFEVLRQLRSATEQALIERQDSA